MYTAVARFNGTTMCCGQAQPEHGVYTTFVEFGNTKVELLEQYGESSPIANFVAKNPQGAIHHICYEVASEGKETEGCRLTIWRRRCSI